MSNFTQLTTKSELLCWGVKTNSVADKIYSLQHPTAHKRTGNAGLHLILESRLVVNVIYGEPFCENSPYSLEEIDGEFWICKNKKQIRQFTPISAPKWYQRRTANGTLMADILLQEGVDTLITAIWNSCCYFRKKEQCKFCVLDSERGVEWKDLNQIKEVVSVAYKENPNYFLHFTGGNTYTPYHGVAYYEKYVKAIRSANSKIPISLEISPPEDINYLKKMVEFGVNGFSINIEVWDEKKRQEICPGKSKIKRELYFKAWEMGTNLLGKFKTSSAILVGLDSEKNIKEAIKILVEIGVKPSLIPFHPFLKSLLNDLPLPDPEELMELSAYAGQLMVKSDIKLSNLTGCEHCGACTLEKDYL